MIQTPVCYVRILKLLNFPVYFLVFPKDGSRSTGILLPPVPLFYWCTTLVTDNAVGGGTICHPRV